MFPCSSAVVNKNVVGRQYAFNLTVLITSIFGLCLGAPSNYSGILVLAAFVGFGVGGNIPIDTTITLEFLPQVLPRALQDNFSLLLTDRRIVASYWQCCQSSNPLAW